jgi:hypothetical protein
VCRIFTIAGFADRFGGLASQDHLCEIRDALFLKKALDAGPGVGAVPTRCDAALSPPNGP